MPVALLRLCVRYCPASLFNLACRQRESYVDKSTQAESTRTKSAKRPSDPERSHAGQYDDLERLAHLLDSVIPLPGGLRVGLGGFLGLISGIGDAIGTLLSSRIVGQAYQMDASRMILLCMAGNIALEAVGGVVAVRHADEVLPPIFRGTDCSTSLATITKTIS